MLPLLLYAYPFSRSDEIILKYLPKDVVDMGKVNEKNCLSEQPSDVSEVNSAAEELKRVLTELDVDMGLMTCSGDVDFYKELLHDFIDRPIKEELQQYLAAQDYKNYCIRIHGFKNSAYSVGAKVLGDLAYEMEQLTRESFPDNMTELQQKFFEQYDKICLECRKIAEE